jgi:hypothetical protein
VEGLSKGDRVGRGRDRDRQIGGGRRGRPTPHHRDRVRGLRHRDGVRPPVAVEVAGQEARGRLPHGDGGLARPGEPSARHAHQQLRARASRALLGQDHQIGPAVEGEVVRRQGEHACRWLHDHRIEAAVSAAQEDAQAAQPSARLVVRRTREIESAVAVEIPGQQAPAGGVEGQLGLGARYEGLEPRPDQHRRLREVRLPRPAEHEVRAVVGVEAAGGERQRLPGERGRAARGEGAVGEAVQDVDAGARLVDDRDVGDAVASEVVHGEQPRHAALRKGTGGPAAGAVVAQHDHVARALVSHRDVGPAVAVEVALDQVGRQASVQGTRRRQEPGRAVPAQEVDGAGGVRDHEVDPSVAVEIVGDGEARGRSGREGVLRVEVARPAPREQGRRPPAGRCGRRP